MTQAERWYASRDCADGVTHLFEAHIHVF